MAEFRVMHLIDHMGLGGAQRVVGGIVNYDSDSYHYVSVLRQKGGNVMSVREDRMWKSKYSMRIFSLLHLIRLPEILKRNNIKIVHSHLNGSWLMAIALRWILGLKEIAYVFHEQDPNEVPQFIYRPLLQIVHRTGKIIAVSGAVRQRLVELGVPEARVRIIRNFIDPDIFFPENDGESHISIIPNNLEEKFVVGFAGRLVARKGWKYILEAANIIEDEEVVFILVGSGPDEKKLKRKIKTLALQERIIFLGREDNMRGFYNALDLFLVPALEEPMGLTQLEAQACGTPVLAFDIPGINETIDSSNSLLVPPNDIKKFAEGIEKLKGDQALYDKLVAGGIENAKRFSIDGFMQQLGNYYEDELLGAADEK